MWKDFEYNGLKYKVSDDGVIVGSRGRALSQRLNKDGYLCVTLGELGRRSVYRVHRIVAQCFIPHDEYHNEVNHIDYDRTNNHIDNLEWVTHIENIHHSAKVGRMSGVRSCENNGRSLLSSEDIPIIRKMIDEGYSNIQIGKKFGVAPSTIWNIKAGNTWTTVV